MADLAGRHREQQLHPPRRSSRTPINDVIGLDRAHARSSRASRSGSRSSSRPTAPASWPRSCPAAARAISTEISAGNRRRRIYPAERPGRRHPYASARRTRTAAPDIVSSEIILPNIRVLAIDQAPKEKDGQNALLGKTVTLELKPEQAEDAGACTPDRHAVAGAAQHRRRQHRREQVPDDQSPKRGESVNVVRYGVQSFDDDTEVKRTSDMKCGGHHSDGADRSWSVPCRSRPSPRLRSPCSDAVLPPIPRLHPAAHQARCRPRPAFFRSGIGKSVVIDLPRDIKDVLVADPKIANAVVRSAQRAYIIGEAVGQTNVVFFDADGQQVASYDIAVKRDLNGVRAALRQTLPGIQIEGVGDGVILTGSVSIAGRGAAGRRHRRAAGWRRRQGRQLDRGARPRPGDVEGQRSPKCGATSSSRWASISAPA